MYIIQFKSETDLFLAVAIIPYFTEENKESPSIISNISLQIFAVYAGGVPNHKCNMNSQSIKKGTDRNNIKKKENLEDSTLLSR